MSGLLGSFTGKTANGYIDQANTQATNALTAGHASAQPYYDKAASVYDPFIAQGASANDAYNNALGLNGADKAQGAWNNYSSNPGFLAAANLGVKNLDRRYNAAGQGNSGAAYAGEANAGLQYYDQYLNRLSGQGQQGLTAASGKSNALTNQGGFEYGYGKDRATNDISYGNAKAGASNLFGQNVLGLAGAALGGLGLAGNLGWKPLGKG